MIDTILINISLQNLVIVILVAFIIGIVLGVSIANQWSEIDVDQRLGGDPTTDAPKPDEKKKPKGK